MRVLGASFAGTLVSDFYAVYNGLDCAKQRCLVHLLRELAKLREELPWQSVRAFIQPLITLFQDAIQLGKDRNKLGKQAFAQARQRILHRFDDLLLQTHTKHPECLRIWRRLFKHCDELFTFLYDPQVPADNNGTERDIRSLAAARNDGGTHRADWSATAFARIKSIIVTGMKNGERGPLRSVWHRGSPCQATGPAAALALGQHQLANAIPIGIHLVLASTRTTRPQATANVANALARKPLISNIRIRPVPVTVH